MNTTHSSDAETYYAQALINSHEALAEFAERDNPAAAKAIELVLRCRGRVIVAGVGKSGIVAMKIAATLASTGTVATFLHAGEATHGDLGIVANGDVAIVLSNSGETAEIKDLLPHLRQRGVPIVALTGRPDSTLGRGADAVIDTSVRAESDSLNLAPTASTTVMMAAGDALACAVMRLRGFTVTEYAALHPGGSLGQQLSCRVQTVMHSGNGIPMCREGVTVRDAIVEITAKRLGVTLVVNAGGVLTGLVTDGDLRRALQREREPLDLPIERIMTRAPKRIGPDWMAINALKLMEDFKITSLPVVDASDKPIGTIHIHDLVSRGIA